MQKIIIKGNKSKEGETEGILLQMSHVKTKQVNTNANASRKISSKFIAGEKGGATKNRNKGNQKQIIKK